MLFLAFRDLAAQPKVPVIDVSVRIKNEQKESSNLPDLEGAVFIDEDVARLYVSMTQVGRVHELQGDHCLVHNVLDVGHAHLAVFLTSQAGQISRH